jgi:hypothetical protein
LNRRKNESHFGNQYCCQYYRCGYKKGQTLSPAFFLFHVKKHDYKNDEHHNGARLNNYLHSGNKRGGQHHVKTGKRYEDTNKGNGAVERIALGHNSDSATDSQTGE